AGAIGPCWSPGGCPGPAAPGKAADRSRSTADTTGRGGLTDSGRNPPGRGNPAGSGGAERGVGLHEASLRGPAQGPRRHFPQAVDNRKTSTGRETCLGQTPAPWYAARPPVSGCSGDAPPAPGT